MRVLAALLLAAPAASQFPVLDSVLPRGGQRGTTVEVVLRGKRLASARELLLEPGGVTVAALEAEDDGRLRASLELAPDAVLGPRAVWVRTAAGITDLGTFHVGALTEVAEVEPNGMPEEAQAVELGVTLNGVAANEDVDLYAFEGGKGTRVSLELEGQRLGDRLFDPAVAVLDPRGFTLASCDDSALGRQDPALTVVLPEDGRYLVQVRESAYRGANDCRYRLHVGTFPRPLATLPLGGRAGQELEVELRSADGPAGTARVTLPEPRPHGGWVPPGVAAVDLGAPTPAWFRVADLDGVREVEPNLAWQEATPFEPPAALDGVLQEERDVDRYRFAASKGQRWIVAAHARSLRTPVDPVLTVHTAEGKYLQGNDDDGGPDSRFEFEVPEDGDYVVQVRDHLSRGGPAFAYRVEVTRPRASITVGIGGQRPQVAVPRGGRATLNLILERRRYGGPLSVELAGLPAGVTAHVPAVPDGLGQVPVLFAATDEAAPASALASVTARAPERDLVGDLYHPVELVTGRNQRVFWAHTLDRLPVAVTDTAPVDVEVVAPGVPLPRAGRVTLDVTVHRREGFEGDVLLRLPFLPPGVSAPRQFSVGKGASTARFELDAAGDARKGAWELWVAAECEGPHGRVQVASAPVPLEVGDPLLAFQAEPVAVDRGRGGEMFVQVTRGAGFEGQATVSLVNLPHHVTSEPRTVEPGTETLTFPVATGEKSPVGHHKGLRFSARVALPEGEVLQGLAAAPLRIQQPAPPPKQAVEAKAGPEKKEKEEPAQAKARPPTRLEKLRAEHEARLQELTGGDG